MPLKQDIMVDAGIVSRDLEDFIREKMEELQREGVVLGLSGGVDTSVVAALAARAVGKEQVLGLIMPERDSDPRSQEDALLLAGELGIRRSIRPITIRLKHFRGYRLSPLIFLSGSTASGLIKKGYRYFREKTGESPFVSSLAGVKGKPYQRILSRGNAYYRIKHRLRMVELYLAAEKSNLLVVGCANKTEFSIGYFVKFGCDHAADIMPLLGLYKSRVLKLASQLKIPDRIINKIPSPDILPGITDEFALGIPYDRLDLILLGLEKGLSSQEIAGETGASSKEIVQVEKMKSRSQHMREIFIPGKHKGGT